MAVTQAMLVSELQELLRLTAFEQTIATVRVSQAASSAVAAELRANAEKCGERGRLLSGAVRDLGAAPDVVGATLARAGALLQTQLNQVQTLQGALLGDLALEHQLRERTRYARTLAVSLGTPQVLMVLDRLETAHTATIEWLETRLGEVARTGTSALRATPVQQAVGGVRRLVGAPFGIAASVVNRGTGLLHRGASTVRQGADEVVEQVERLPETAAGLAQEAGERVRETATTVLDEAQRDVAAVADAAGADTTDGTAADTTADGTPAVTDVTDVTDLDPEHEPFAAYRTLTGDSVMRHVAQLEDVAELRATLAYELAHKARKGVLQAIETRLRTLPAG